MATTRCGQLLCLTLGIFCSGMTVATGGDIIGGKGGGSAECAAGKTKNWSYAFRPATAFPMVMHLQRINATWQHLQTAEQLLEQIKSIADRLPMTDCSDIFKLSNGIAKSGVWAVRPAGANHTVPAYCRMEGGEGWTVLMRRQDGSVDFYRTWDEFKRGFGDPTAEHWLGNDVIHFLTNQDNYKLRVDLETWDGETTYAEYSTFFVADEASAYKLTAGRYSGTAKNSLWRIKGRPFVTWDRDTDSQMARKYTSAGWLCNPYVANFFGVYYTPQTAPAETKNLKDAMSWTTRLSRPSKITWLKFVELRIARKVP
ncbi:fibrinogen-like protein A [Branchiostoma floridae]|uniref:Fibrinogen-like protein A n=1 Tax=Branchiostoma floridae TaxID=7739 RepID=A0A9J7KR44_BRAFL|nr:fibrinogen-like protein A [Branchiostoma floridae]